MAKRYFGTDGIRGRVNRGEITPQLAMKVGLAAGKLLRDGDHKHRVVIGKDTRRSCYMLEAALASGFSAAGMDVTYLGPMPTPAVARMVKSLRADVGVMISASHNAHHDNGMKFFGPDGYKISDEMESRIEELIDADENTLLADSETLGHIGRLNGVKGRYVEFAKSTIESDISLEGMKIVLDCANGAAHRVGPQLLEELGAEVIALGVSPNGLNINDGCGSTAPEVMSAKVVEEKAAIGIALDGDADRIIVCDETGTVIDGDQLLALIGRAWKKSGKLRGNTIVATVMSNMGLGDFLNGIGIDLVRTPVGDRHVVKEMRANDYNVGGEQSGHIVLSDYATTGDGIVSGLQILAEMVQTGKKASEICSCFSPYPQILKNVRFTGKDPLDNSDVQASIVQQEKQLGDQGRVFIRKSGTEPLIRVMVEGRDHEQISEISNELVDAIKKGALR